ncbi:hypothetical protein [Pseudomonas boanensis]|uniref:hypothetical protein n=1 Tax=Metapseudomonas boanensis TaxID=2822138 RepID=UPI0035D49707
MKAHALAALFITALSTSAFALPSDPQPLLGESKDGTFIQVLDPVAAEGSFMILDRVAEGGADRTLERIAEGGAERTQDRIAEGGADRALERIAEGGSDRLLDDQRVI